MENTTKAFIGSAMGVGMMAFGVSAFAQATSTPAFPAYGQETAREIRAERSTLSEKGFAKTQGHKKGKRHGKGMGSLYNKEGVSVSTEKLSNGTKTTVVVADAEVLAEMKAKMAEKESKRADREAKMAEAGREMKAKPFTREISETANGFVITMTSDDAEKVEKMHEKADRMALKQSITKNVEKTENGVVMTITSDNAEAITMIQEKSEKEGKERENVTKQTEVLANGIRVTVTGADAETIEKIHNKADNPGQKRMGKRGGKGMKGVNKARRGQRGNK